MTKYTGDGYDIPPPQPPWRAIIAGAIAVLGGTVLMVNHQPFALWAAPLFAQNVASLSDGIILAISTYEDMYDAFPGDDPKAGERWGDDMACPASARCGSNSIDYGKSGMAWAHLRAAELIAGPPRLNGRPNIGPPTAMVHLPFSFKVGILGPDETTLCIDGVPLPAAIRIDRRYDDGNPLTGDVRSILQVSGEDGDGVPRMRLCRKIWR
jgi:hypothetical protein